MICLRRDLSHWIKVMAVICIALDNEGQIINRAIELKRCAIELKKISHRRHTVQIEQNQKLN